MKSLTENGFSGHIVACCHRVEFWYDTGNLDITEELIEALTEEAENRAAYCINDGCPRGELNCLYLAPDEEEHEIRGWFGIE